ncbi:hypothetical protein [Bacteroides reticulotermitis]|uniref:Uncharacterized protein n=1 Tax=Bacteroides reticulotermitis TaxID=1133319 RepID=A0A840D599_9BACE|nr:hypothetical protein [Bacteroides reticulotermitis]MBB4043855.1 hypothetical protein [Bacteroides reticulotermitis]
MKRYRIVQGSAYNGCFPITVWWVQVRKDGFFSDKWVNVKGFDTYQRALDLYNLLQ